MENYFKIIGDVNPEKICDKFGGKEKVICSFLFSWLHDGSHYMDDDLYIAADDGQIDLYLKVFRLFFKKGGHIPHYNMMTGLDE